jgi:hypothetical protein
LHAEIAPPFDLTREDSRDLVQRERRDRIVAVHEDRERAAQRLRIERGVRDAEGDRIVVPDGAVLGALRGRELRAHGRERRFTLGERGGREARAGQHELEADLRMRRGKARGDGLQHLAHVVVAHHRDRAFGREIRRARGHRHRVRLVTRQRRVHACGVGPGAEDERRESGLT